MIFAPIREITISEKALIYRTNIPAHSHINFDRFLSVFGYRGFQLFTFGNESALYNAHHIQEEYKTHAKLMHQFENTLRRVSFT